jgi:hypothetical protein
MDFARSDFDSPVLAVIFSSFLCAASHLSSGLIGGFRRRHFAHFKNPFSLSQSMTARWAIHAAGRSSDSPAFIKAWRACGVMRMLKAIDFGAGGFVVFFIVALDILSYTCVYH